MKNFRENIIEAVKAMGITANELGICPVTRYEVDIDFLKGVQKLIGYEDIDPATARDCIPEKYWEDLGIAEKTYQVVRVTLSKTIRQDIYVAIPDDTSIYDVGDYINNMEEVEWDEDEGDDWEVDDQNTEESDMTAEEVRNNYTQGELWNFDDFDE